MNNKLNRMENDGEVTYKDADGNKVISIKFNTPAPSREACKKFSKTLLQLYREAEGSSAI